ncbi:hypothetical protein ADG881_523 [Alcanivorax sp. DG881]|nr:hypothetical protein ADG881_523 [Alcanivorax sp. DG881]
MRAAGRSVTDGMRLSILNRVHSSMRKNGCVPGAGKKTPAGTMQQE